MIDFVLDEQRGIEPADAAALAAVDALGRLDFNDGRGLVTPDLPTLRQYIVDLLGRLERSEDANLVMREHLVMLSEELRRAKAVLRSPSSPPPSSQSERPS